MTIVTSAPFDITVTSNAPAEADWQARISAPGVVWYHTFDNEAEVDAFRWTNGFGSGNDPNAVGSAYADNVRHVASGGADGGGYMELLYENTASGSSYWWRPTSPLASPGNGRDSDDPAASGTLTVGSYTATSGGDQIATWADSSNAKPGWYAHPDDSTSYHDGSGFYAQIRVWADPRRTLSGQPSVGKFTSFTTTNDSNTNQEQVTYSSFAPVAGLGTDNIHNIYDGWAYSPLVDITGASGGDANPISPKWSYSTTGWDTLLYHITPGVDGGVENRMEVWAAQDGETEYTKIWDWSYPIHYTNIGNGAGGIARDGWNAMLCWMYQNGVYSSTFWQRYDQMIFSKNFIPMPQSGDMPSWYPAVGEVVEIDSGTTINGACSQTGTGLGYSGITSAWSGGTVVYVDGKPYLCVSGCGHSDGQFNGILKFGPLYGGGSDSPTWSTFISPSADGDANSTHVYDDGRLAGNHTYNADIGVGDRYYKMAHDGGDANGGSGTQAAYYTSSEGQVNITSNPRTGGEAICTGHWMGKIYCMAGGSQFDELRIYDIADNSWSSEGVSRAFSNYMKGAVDTNRGGFFACGGGQYTGSAYWQLPSLSVTTSITGPSNSNNTLLFDPERDVFVSWTGGKSVTETDAANLYNSGTVSWSTRNFTGDTPSSGEAAGTYGRFGYVPELKGYIVAPNSNSSVYFFRSA